MTKQTFGKKPTRLAQRPSVRQQWTPSYEDLMGTRPDTVAHLDAKNTEAAENMRIMLAASKDTGKRVLKWTGYIFLGLFAFYCLGALSSPSFYHDEGFSSRLCEITYGHTAMAETCRSNNRYLITGKR